MPRILVRPHPAYPDRSAESLLRDLGAAAEVVLGLSTATLYDLAGTSTADALRAARELLSHPLVEVAEAALGPVPPGPGERIVTVVRRPGVMDPVVGSTLDAFAALHIPCDGVRIARSFVLRMRPQAPRGAGDEACRLLARKVANPVIEEVLLDRIDLPAPPPAARASHGRVALPLGRLAEENERRGLNLSPRELAAVADHFRSLGRDPTDLEVETIAQTWSEHCKHKTMNGPVAFDPCGMRSASGGNGGGYSPGPRRFGSLLKETIFRATREIDAPFVRSAFVDNAGVFAIDARWGIAAKVETHNHPSALEPYGGAGTGLGGVIRDILGTGLGALPILDIDVFGLPPPDLPAADLPGGALHPLASLRGIVRGVADYGNRMGIPTPAGALVFDPRYAANPVVYCGTIGLIPLDRVAKRARPGDVICLVGGRTGRDGIHGATFSSAELDARSEQASGGAVQIGNAIEERKLLDALMRARDEGLYTAVTDCGAGGLSSAVGEMANQLDGDRGAARGADVDLEKVPLKYEGLAPAEIWISEAQERMVLAVPERAVERLVAIFHEEGSAAVPIGRFTDAGDLVCRYAGTEMGRLDLGFLHDGMPREERRAVPPRPAAPAPALPGTIDAGAVLLAALADWDVCSKAPVFRRYDHEVQGTGVVRPRAGPRGGPSDGVVIAPVPGSRVGIALGLGIAPRLGDLDPHGMARACVDEALRNAVASGGDPDHAVLLDNFSWGNTARPDVLGALVLAAEGCREAALGFGTPFVSGKDSLMNEYRQGERAVGIPPTLLVTCIARVPDVERSVTTFLKQPGDVIFVAGSTRDDLGGSLLHRVLGLPPGGTVPAPDLGAARAVYRAFHRSVLQGLVRAAHDPSEGGLAVALAEMAIGSNLGIDASVDGIPVTGPLRPEVALFSETGGRLVVAAAPEHTTALEALFREAGAPIGRIGTVALEPRLRVSGGGRPLLDVEVERLRSTWEAPLAQAMG